MLNQVEEKIKNDASRILSDATLCKECVEEEDKLPPRSHKLLQIETFVEEVLEEVWTEVFSCLSQIEHKVDDLARLEPKCMPHCISMQHNKASKFHYVCSMKDETAGSNQFRNEHFNHQAVVSCHDIPDTFNVAESRESNIGATDKQHLVSTSLKSIGCVNPTFVGSGMDPDLLEHAVVPGAPTVECDSFFLSTDLSGFVGIGAEDTDSGFNTVSLDSNHRTINADSFKDANEHSNVCQHVCVMEKARTESYTASPNEIHPTALRPCISADSQFSGEITEAKDDAHRYNQITFTSVDVRLPDTCKTQGSNKADVGCKSQKSEVEHRKIKQCYHTTNLRRLVSHISIIS
jgi:hypothetical protein